MLSLNELLQSPKSTETTSEFPKEKSLLLSQFENNTVLSEIVSNFETVKSMHLDFQNEINNVKLSFRKVFEESRNQQTNLFPTRTTSEITHLLSHVGSWNQKVLEKDFQISKSLTDFSENIKRLSFESLSFYESSNKKLIQENLKLNQTIQLQTKINQMSLEGTLFNYFMQRISFLERIVSKKESVINEIQRKRECARNRKAINTLLLLKRSAELLELWDESSTTNQSNVAHNNEHKGYFEHSKTNGHDSQFSLSAFKENTFAENANNPKRENWVSFLAELQLKLKANALPNKKEFEELAVEVEKLRIKSRAVKQLVNSNCSENILVNFCDSTLNKDSEISSKNPLWQKQDFKQLLETQRNLNDQLIFRETQFQGLTNKLQNTFKETRKFLVKFCAKEETLQRLKLRNLKEKQQVKNQQLKGFEKENVLRKMEENVLKIGSCANGLRKQRTLPIISDFKLLELDISQLIELMNQNEKREDGAKNSRICNDSDDNLALYQKNAEEIRKMNTVVSSVIIENTQLSSQNKTMQIKLFEKEKEIDQNTQSLLEMSEKLAILGQKSSQYEEEIKHMNVLIQKKKEKIRQLINSRKVLEEEILVLTAELESNNQRLREAVARIFQMTEENIKIQLLFEDEISKMSSLIDQNEKLKQDIAEGEQQKHLMSVLEEQHQDLIQKQLKTITDLKALVNIAEQEKQGIEKELARRKRDERFQKKVMEPLEIAQPHQTIETTLMSIKLKNIKAQKEELDHKVVSMSRMLREEQAKVSQLQQKIAYYNSNEKPMLQNAIKDLREENGSLKKSAKTVTNAVQSVQTLQKTASQIPLKKNNSNLMNKEFKNSSKQEYKLFKSPFRTIQENKKRLF
jgi:hypothetical protein